MKYLLSIDPGVHHLGVAVWASGELSAARYIAAGELCQWLRDQVGWMDDIACEKMQVYTSSKQKGDPNDLIDVMISVCELIGAIKNENPAGATSKYYWPHDWKQDMPKDIVELRVLERLTDHEKQCIELPRAKSIHHNIYEAIGIGLHHLGCRLWGQRSTTTQRRGPCTTSRP